MDLDEFLGTIKMTAPKQIIWKIAPTYKPYRMTIANKLSCGISNASILLNAMNSSTLTVSKKQDTSYKIINQSIFDEYLFGREFFALVELSFVQISHIHTTIRNKLENHLNAKLIRKI